MLFNSLGFLMVFLPVTYVVFWSLSGRTARYTWLAATGYVFYGFWNWKFCALMAFSTLVAYLAGLGLLRWQDPRRRRWCLVLPVAGDLLLLGIFKYANFTVASAGSLASWLGLSVATPVFDVVLPVGISFYTFHTITYVVDGYRGVIRPTRNLAEFSCYVSLFAQLVAGPIVRFGQIEGDLDRIDRADRRDHLDVGCSFFVLGLASKVLVADPIASVIDPALARYAELTTVEVWLCMLGYTFQIYFDFSGYSDMAVGLGHLFGLRLPQNFRSPYRSVDLADFWRRWHISLSSVLRDYLYIPLGGSRGRAGWLVYRNLLLTMLLGGLWHGASWTFVVWGGYHGVLLALHRATAAWWARRPAALRRGLTFLAVVVGWVFFRAGDFGMATTLLARMFRWHGGDVTLVGAPLLVGLLLLAGAVTQLSPDTFALRHDWSPAAVAALVVLFAVALLAVAGSPPAPFLYFQF